MLQTANLGYPRIGANRELKKATESYWKNLSSIEDLENTAKEIRLKNWNDQKNSGIKYIPSNDFSLYDQTLDMIALLGAIPERFNHDKSSFIDNNLYFAMARGMQRDGVDVTAMEMTKWLDTNYHYIVPEFYENQNFKISSNKIFDHYQEALNNNITTRPVILGPISFLILGKSVDGSNKFNLLNNLLKTYKELFNKFNEIGISDIQIDEPCLVTDLDADIKSLYIETYNNINEFRGNVNIHLATYFDSLDNNCDTAFSLNTKSVHIDLVRAGDQLEIALKAIKDNQYLSLGVVNGRNIWINDFEKSISLVNKAIEKLGKDRVIIAPSCSLLHCPVDLDNESDLDNELKSWMSFAKQKLNEISIIAAACDAQDVNDAISENKIAINNRKTSSRINNEEVKNRVASNDPKLIIRGSEFSVRQKIQKSKIELSLLPTTTIGSFPQTKDVRKKRADYKASRISKEEYQEFLEQQIISAIKYQEEIDLDVLVHGEFERNDMVEYFGEKLSGFCFTKNGWVQSYGTRCVKPPVIFGDVCRPNPMTVDWTIFAQKQTSKIVKGMLTGPITILQWSFVRDDQPRKDTARQIAFAIRDEVVDLEKAGIKMIQIDEAALREGLPIRKKDWQNYLDWAVESFKISSCGVKDETQIHTHMCYSEFNDIIKSIANMDADVISIETSRSQMELLDAFIDYKYPNEIGPGVYDIHSPRVPSIDEIEILIKKALDVLDVSQIWINPDCGLKTRDWPETKTALENMVKAAKNIRKKLQ
ncbi:MAG: 5-methyltetrahydropteroyltriglutamate--homocysteine S-methyltransferase [Rickettsiales bacterium]|jgi:5-methyltetrahydropteroyltriglutamate--homocysteine methyltransferase|nr:5-methyltetrahydropteroyltriglutamate--homocysteine S-methyltransferase [Rickettsiales bacterium]|tara:strand:+ start:13162 stop:15447 length:2286 start_codon:yes stop_codon:yes gene_type:complete